MAITDFSEFSDTDLYTLIVDASDKYHNGEESPLSDAEFDLAERTLLKVSPNHPYFSTIGADVRGGKVPLPYPMAGLDEIYEGETEKWIRLSGWSDEYFVISDKLDGTSGLLVYGKGGQFMAAYSRGNGTEGADISRHVRRMLKVPLVMDEPCVVRVEFILTEANFAKLNVDGEYKNARNYTAGKMNASDPNDDFCALVDVIATSLVFPQLDKTTQIEYLEAQKFVVPTNKKVLGKLIGELYLQGTLAERRKQSPWAIDGIVIDLNSKKIRNSLERNGSSIKPLYAKKYKVGATDNVAEARVVKVHWEASKLGYLKPRVEIHPVELVGVTITFATGHNAKNIWDNGIGPGALVSITRSGDVIPYIQEVIEPAPPQLPDEPQYGFGPMSWTESGVDMVLDYPEDNDDVRKNQIIAFFQGIDAAGIREGAVDELYDNYDDGNGCDAADIIRLQKGQLIHMLGANGAKIYDSIQAKLNPITLGILAGSSQCFPRGIGRRKMTKLCEALNIETPEQLEAVRASKIAFIDGFDAKTAEKIVAGLPKFMEFVRKIDGFYTLATKAAATSNELAAINVVFTGVRSKELEDIITSKGGTIGSTVSGKTTHVVCKDPGSGSGKLKKATDLGLKVGEHIITLGQAENMWK